MRRILLSLFATLCIASAAHAAQGINLRWDACLADGGVSNKNFACDTNTGSETLVLTLQLDTEATQVTGTEFILNVATPSGMPPLWWTFRSGSCRPSGLSIQPSPPANSTCTDPWLGQAAGGLAGYVLTYPQYRVMGMLAVPMENALTLAADVEYVVARITISHSASTGTGSCPGCAAQACLGAAFVKLQRPVGVGNTILATETVPGSSTVSWQGSPVVSDFVHNYAIQPGHYQDYRVLACQSTSPAPNRTWGMIKTQYR